MDTDLALTVGSLLMVLSVPSLLAGWVEGRVSRLGAILFVGSGALIIYALTVHPGGYAFRDVPSVIVNVLIGVFT